jgi:hypothetical protein
LREDVRVTAHEPWVTLPGRVVGSSLTAAGLAGWVLSKNDHGHEADETRELQDALEAALRFGNVGAVRVRRLTVERAASLWEAAATLLESWSESVGDYAEADRQAARPRARVRSLRQALEAD